MWNRKQEIELWSKIYFSMKRTISLFHSNSLNTCMVSCKSWTILEVVENWVRWWVCGIEEEHGGFEHMAVVRRSLLPWLAEGMLDVWEDQEWIVASVMVKLQLFSGLQKSLTPFLEYESMAGIAQACWAQGAGSQWGKGSPPPLSNSRSSAVVGWEALRRKGGHCGPSLIKPENGHPSLGLLDQWEGWTVWREFPLWWRFMTLPQICLTSSLLINTQIDITNPHCILREGDVHQSMSHQMRIN